MGFRDAVAGAHQESDAGIQIAAQPRQDPLGGKVRSEFARPLAFEGHRRRNQVAGADVVKLMEHATPDGRPTEVAISIVCGAPAPDDHPSRRSISAPKPGPTASTSARSLGAGKPRSRTSLSTNNTEALA